MIFNVFVLTYYYSDCFCNYYIYHWHCSASFRLLLLVVNCCPLSLHRAHKRRTYVNAAILLCSHSLKTSDETPSYVVRVTVHHHLQMTRVPVISPPFSVRIQIIKHAMFVHRASCIAFRLPKRTLLADCLDVCCFPKDIHIHEYFLIFFSFINLCLYVFII
jgi:hypothetical protein